MRYSKAEVEEARASLRFLRPGKTIYTVLRHRAASGMFRRISLLVWTPRGPRYLDWGASRLLGCSVPDHGEGLGVPGAGMDMGFHLVNRLGQALFPKGFKLAKNRHGRNGDKSGFEKDGGYAFEHRWI